MSQASALPSTDSVPDDAVSEQASASCEEGGAEAPEEGSVLPPPTDSAAAVQTPQRSEMPPVQANVMVRARAQPEQQAAFALSCPCP